MKRETPKGSLRIRLYGVVAILALMLGFETISIGQKAWNDYETMKRIKQLDDAANNFSAGLFEVLMERLYTNNALQAPAPIDDSTRREIEARRKTVREKYEPGLAALKQVDFPNRTSLLATLDTTLARANDARRNAERAVTLPRDQRDEAVRSGFVPTITQSVNASLDVWLPAMHTYSSADPKLATLAVIKELGWRLRDIAGFERSNVSQAIAGGTGITPERAAQNLAVRAQIDVLWRIIENLTTDPTTDPVILAAMAGARDRYFGAFRQAADAMKQISDAGRTDFGMTAAQWTDLTTPQLGSLLNIMYAAATASEKRTEQLTTAAFDEFLLDALILAAALIVIAALVIAVELSIIRPIGRLDATMRELATGNATLAVPFLNRGDEIGGMARSVDVFRQAYDEVETLRAAQRESEAAATSDRRAVMTKLADSFETSVSTLVHSVAAATTKMGNSAAVMVSAADNASSRADIVSTAARQASSNVQTVASAAEELHASISEIGRQMHRSTTVASQAVEQTVRTDELVQGLSEKAKSIGDVVKLINSIAGQTNLLALNATIEAARAGEAGRGFAVVASEVKNLATQTATATGDIAAQVSSIQAATDAAVAAIKEIAATIIEINGISTTIASAVEEQSAATREIARNVHEASSGTTLVSTNIVEVTDAVAETGRASADVKSESRALGEQFERLKGEVDRFVTTIRAA